MRPGELLMGLGRPVSYYPALARLVGVKECVFICQFLYWFDKTAEGWVYKTQEEITAETGMSRAEQETVRRNLKKTGILEERHARLLHRMFYRISLDRLAEVWDRDSDEGNPHSGELSLDLGLGGNPAPAAPAKPHSFLGAETTTKTTSKAQKGIPLAQMPLIPTALTTPEFEAAWSDWLAYRREAKKAVTITTAKHQLGQLEKMGAQNAVLSIRQSIGSQWQGLFEPRENTTNGSKTNREANGRRFEQTSSYAGITDK